MPSDFQKYVRSLADSLPSEAEEFSLRTAPYKCLNAEDGAFLGRILEKRPIVSLELSCGFFNSEGLKGFASFLPKMKDLMTLDIAVNGLGKKDADLLAGVLPATKIRRLSLKGNALDGDGAEKLFAVLPETRLRSLSVGHNGLGEKGAARLAEGIVGSKIKTLDLAAARLADEGVAVLAEALPRSFVRKLNLGANGITAKGVCALARVLPETNLESLALYGNAVGDEGVKRLAETLPRSKITELNLFNASFSDEGAKYLLMALQAPSCRVSKLKLGLLRSANGDREPVLSSMLANMLTKAAEANGEKEKMRIAEREAERKRDFDAFEPFLKSIPVEAATDFDMLMKAAQCGRLPDVMTALADKGRVLPAEMFFRPNERGDTLLDIISERRQFSAFFKAEHFDSAQKLQRIWEEITPDDRKQPGGKNGKAAFQKIKNAVMSNAVKRALKGKGKKNIGAAFRTVLKQKFRGHGKR